MNYFKIPTDEINDIHSEEYSIRTTNALNDLKSDLYFRFHKSDVWGQISELLVKSENTQSENEKYRIPHDYYVVDKEK